MLKEDALGMRTRGPGQRTKKRWVRLSNTHLRWMREANKQAQPKSNVPLPNIKSVHAQARVGLVGLCRSLSNYADGDTLCARACVSVGPCAGLCSRYEVGF